MEADTLKTETAIADGATAVFVDRMLDRVMARPGICDALGRRLRRSAEAEARVALRGVLAVIAHLPSDLDVVGARLKQKAADSRWDDKVCPSAGSHSAPDPEPAERREASQACRRLLYVFSAGVNPHMMAQLLLLKSYRACAEHQHNQSRHEQLLPLVQRLCGPVEWARTAACCHQFHALGLAQRGLLSYWLRGYSREGQNEALKHAIQNNVIGLVRPLVDADADVNCVFEQFWFRTPLHRAASRGNVGLCKLLLSLRADSAKCDSHGACPIHLVASKGRLMIVDLLLRHDINSANVVDYAGRSPMHMAALKGNLSCVKRIATARGNIAAQALDWQTPLDMAVRCDHTDVCAFVESWTRRLEQEAEASRATPVVLSSLYLRLSANA